jgi:hypothetical protein
VTPVKLTLPVALAPTFKHPNLAYQQSDFCDKLGRSSGLDQLLEEFDAHHRPSDRKNSFRQRS